MDYRNKEGKIPREQFKSGCFLGVGMKSRFFLEGYVFFLLLLLWFALPLQISMHYLENSGKTKDNMWKNDTSLWSKWRTGHDKMLDEKKTRYKTQMQGRLGGSVG